MVDIYTDEVVLNIDDGQTLDIDRSIDKTEEKSEHTRRIELMRNVYQKLDNLPLSFGLPAYSSNITDEMVENKFGIHLKDAMREMRISSINDTIEEGSYDEYMVENRILYYALRSFRFSASVFFKFSTAIDGKTVDKTKIPEFLKDLFDELQDEYNKYKGKNSGNMWTIKDTNLTGRSNRDD